MTPSTVLSPAGQKSKFSEEQIAYALRQAHTGTPVGDVCRQDGVSEATLDQWKKKFAHLGANEVRRVRQLEDENARLKRQVADLTNEQDASQRLDRRLSRDGEHDRDDELTSRGSYARSVAAMSHEGEDRVERKPAADDDRRFAVEHLQHDDAGDDAERLLAQHRPRQRGKDDEIDEVPGVGRPRRRDDALGRDLVAQAVGDVVGDAGVEQHDVLVHQRDLAAQVGDAIFGDVVADERKLKQILLNLLSNAVKFTPDGGRIDVRARQEESVIRISVADTGVGIAQADQEAVFEEFRQVGTHYTSKQEGTGLGLALTRRFVELHGGTIGVESEPGKGSTFTFTLPRTR